MTSTTKFIDTNIFIERFSNPLAKNLTDHLDPEKHFTSVLVLSELYHKLQQKRIMSISSYIKGIMSAIRVEPITQNDLFNAMRNNSMLEINDRIHLEVMKRNNAHVIVSYDKGFDADPIIEREEPR